VETGECQVLLRWVLTNDAFHDIDTADAHEEALGDVMMI
jgi:hypothetical protein